VEFQKARSLKIGDVIFIIDEYNVIYRKEVTGIKLTSLRELDISCGKPVDNLFSRASYEEYTLSHENVFLKESDALEVILRVKKSEVSSVNNAIKFVQKKLTKALEREVI